MNSRPRVSRSARAAAIVTAAAVSLGGALFASPALAADGDTAVSDATLTWGMSAETGGGAFAGGCNFLSAGASGNAGSSRTWTETEGLYSPSAGNVQILKPNAAGDLEAATWANKCLDANGAAVRPTSVTSLTGNVVRISEGAGTRTADGSVSINWDGAFTVVFYGGMTYWSASNPSLNLDAAGNGTLTATASGYAASMEDASVFTPITPRTITLAKFTGGALTDSTFTGTPEYLGVETTSATPQVRTGAAWGSFPQDFIDFQGVTGQSSYWFSSGGSRDAAKVASPLRVAFTAETSTTPEVPTEAPEEIEVNVPEQATPETGSFGWAFASQNPVRLGTATQQGQNFVAVGTLNDIVVTDTRAGGTAAHTWSISGAVSDFANGAAKFSGGFLGWTPKVSGAGASVTAGPAVASTQTGGAGLATSAVLASSTAAAAATVGADLSLVIPASTAAGTYKAKLTVTALN